MMPGTATDYTIKEWAALSQDQRRAILYPTKQVYAKPISVAAYRCARCHRALGGAWAERRILPTAVCHECAA